MQPRTGPARTPGSPIDHGSEDELLRAVKEAASAEYDVLGEMGKGERGSVVYLGRERSSKKLVALKLRRNGNEYELSVVRQLDATVPAMGLMCPACHVDLVGWGRFCSHCGQDLSSARPNGASSEQLIQAVQTAAAGKYEVLGEMERPDGNGAVYFARENASQRLVALRLTREAASDGAESFALGETQVIKPLVASLGATYGSSATRMETDPAQSARNVAPSPRSPQPSAKSPTPPSVMIPEPLPDEELPPFPKERLPVLPIVSAAAIVVVLVGVFFATRGGGIGSNAVADAPAGTATVPAAAVAIPPTPAESGYVAIGTLPASALVMVNGKSYDTRQLTLLPGVYRLSATAPGYRGASDRVVVTAGQAITWSPVLERAPVVTKKPRAVVAQKPTTPAAPNCFNAYSDKKWAAAFAACTREGNAGNQSAQRNLGVMYEQGLGAPHDDVIAANWFRKAALTGNRDAAFQLATMYENGRGVSQDPAQAINWYRKAALLGDGDSQVKLGTAYENGKGVAKDAGEAAAWYQRASDQGSLFATNHLGALYADGRGVPRDEAKAVKLFQSAAGKGDAQGQYNLATMYAKGRGVARSDSSANALYVKSARQGFADAIKEANRRKLKI
jgi:TPR repeat protein